MTRRRFLARAAALAAGAAAAAGCSGGSPSAGGAGGEGGAELVAWGGGPEQHGALRRPAGSPPFTGWPVVVLVHGGYWGSSYDLSLEDEVAADLTAGGLLTWVPEYRRVGQRGFEPQRMLDDVAAGIDHLARVEGVDLQKVAFVGHSAGGQLAAWAALTAERRGAAVRPRGVVAQAGVLDLEAAERDGLGGGAVRRTFGRLRDAADPARLLPAAVPITCVHGAADRVVPIDQSRRFVAASLAAGGVPAKLEAVPGEAHFEALRPGTQVHARTTAAVRGALGV